MLMQRDQPDQRYPDGGWDQAAEWTALAQQHELAMQIRLPARELEASPQMPPACHPGGMEARERAHASDVSGRRARIAAYNFATLAPALLMSGRTPFPEDPFPLLERGGFDG